MSNESVELTSSNELLDLISEINTLLHVVAVVTMIEAEFIWVALSRMRAHPLRPWELLPNLHQHLSFRGIERGVAVEPFERRASPNSMVWAPLLTSSERGPDVPMSGMKGFNAMAEARISKQLL